jgi:hypothetical protein
MVAFRPDPESLTPLEEQTGSWAAKETLLVDPPHSHRNRRALGRRSSRGYTIPVDADKDPVRNPQKAEYTDEEMTPYHELAISEKGGRGVIAALHRAREENAQQNFRRTEATPEELAAQHDAATEGWPQEDDDTSQTNRLDDPAWAWKRPDGWRHK